MKKYDIETLIGALENSAESYPQRKIFFSDFRKGHQGVSLFEIAETSKRYACRLQRLGLKKGDLVGLLLSSRPEFVFSFLGALRIGGVPMPMQTYTGLQSITGFRERLVHVTQKSGVRYLVTESRFLDVIKDAVGKEFSAKYRWLTPEELEAEGEGTPCYVPGSNDLCLVQYTSGSTTAPRGVALTHSNVLAGLRAIVHGIQVREDDIWCSWLPLYHDMGLIGMLCALAYGITQYLYSPRSFIGAPGKWLHEFSKCGATVYAGPNFSFAYMLTNIKERQLAGLDLSQWRIAFNGSEPISPLVVEKFIERFSQVGFRPQTMFPVFGLAEATLAVSFPAMDSRPITQWVDRQVLAEEGKAVKVERSSNQARGVVAVGKAVLGHTIRILDFNGRELPENWVGEIQVKGPAVASGYYADPDESAATLRDGWLCTGDLGYISEGLLYIVGRAKEMIVVNGRKFYPYDVEQLGSNISGVHRGHCIALGDTNGATEQMIVVVETALDSEAERTELANKLRFLLRARLGLASVRIFLLKPGAVPRTSSGKYQRLLLRDKLLQGNLQDKVW